MTLGIVAQIHGIQELLARGRVERDANPVISPVFSLFYFGRLFREKVVFVIPVTICVKVRARILEFLNTSA